VGQPGHGQHHGRRTGHAGGQPRAIVVDEVPLVRVGVGSVLSSLGVEVVVETQSGRQAVSATKIEGVDLAVVGASVDLSVAETVRRLLHIRPRPAVVALLPPAHEDAVRYLVALGTDGIQLRNTGGDDLAIAVAAALKGEQFVAPALHGALAGGVRPLENATHDDSALSGRERQVLALLAAGQTNREMAAELSVSLATVKTHLVRLYAKLGVSNRNEALGRAVAKGLLH
jgi:DNA-binding NarL/FixJ family response regulator